MSRKEKKPTQDKKDTQKQAEKTCSGLVYMVFALFEFLP